MTHEVGVSTRALRVACAVGGVVSLVSAALFVASAVTWSIQGQSVPPLWELASWATMVVGMGLVVVTTVVLARRAHRDRQTHVE